MVPFRFLASTNQHAGPQPFPQIYPGPSDFMKNVLTALLLSLVIAGLAADVPRPTILSCLSNDRSWPHASAYGELGIKTHAFDCVARAGAWLSQVYRATPSGTPSRSVILSGQDFLESPSR